jgi:hypothetical protein
MTPSPRSRVEPRGIDKSALLASRNARDLAFLGARSQATADIREKNRLHLEAQNGASVVLAGFQNTVAGIPLVPVLAVIAMIGIAIYVARR